MSAKRSLMIAALSSTLFVWPLAAQDMKGHHHSATTAEAGTASKALEAANAKMHEAMSIDYSGNPDVDFVRSMIPHHQGAIDMARVQLEHGKDLELRKLAEEVIKAQEAEIVEMQAWLTANDK